MSKEVFGHLKDIEDWMSFIAGVNIAIIGIFMYLLTIFKEWIPILFLVTSAVILIATFIRHFFRKTPSWFKNEKLIEHLNHLEHSIFIWMIWIFFLLAFFIGENQIDNYWKIKFNLLWIIGLTYIIVGSATYILRKKQIKKQEEIDLNTRLNKLRFHSNLSAFVLFLVVGLSFLGSNLHIGWNMVPFVFSLIFLIIIIKKVIRHW